MISAEIVIREVQATAAQTPVYLSKGSQSIQSLLWHWSSLPDQCRFSPIADVQFAPTSSQSLKSVARSMMKCHRIRRSVTAALPSPCWQSQRSPAAKWLRHMLIPVALSVALSLLEVVVGEKLNLR